MATRKALASEGVFGGRPHAGNPRVRRLFAVIAAALAGCALTGFKSGDGAVDSIRVATYNIRTATCDKNTPNAWEDRKEDLADLVRGLNLDAGGLQEVRPEQLAFLRERMPEFEFVGEHRGADRVSDEASPVFFRRSRFEAERKGTFWLSETPDVPGVKGWGAACPRVCSYLILRDKSTGRRFCFANTHTDHKSALAREKGMLLVIERMKEFGAGAPVVFTGDHNCRETEAPAVAVSKLLNNALYESETPPKGSWRTFNGWHWRDAEPSVAAALKLPANVRNARKGSPDADKDANGGHVWEDLGARIDYIYVSRGVRVMDYETVDAPRPGKKLYPSDHFPIVATIELKGDEQGGAPDFTGCLPKDRIRTIALVMPASIQGKSRFDSGKAALEAAGYKVKVMPRLNFKSVAPVEDRVADFEQAWMDPEVDLVLCARGGRGAEDLLDKIDWAKLRTRKQRVLGFSNITMILNAMLKEKAGHPFSGPTLSQFLYARRPAFDWLRKAVAEDGPMPDVKLHALRPGACSGTACGGHVDLVLRGVRMGWAADTEGRIVFLETSPREPSAVRAILDELVSRGYFEKCAGVVFGDLAASGPNRAKLSGKALKAAKDEMEQIKKDFAAKVTCPVYDGYPYGHVPVSYAIDFLRKKTITDDGVLRQ